MKYINSIYPHGHSLLPHVWNPSVGKIYACVGVWAHEIRNASRRIVLPLSETKLL